MTQPVVAEVKAGRRAFDWHVIESNGSSVFFWIFGVVLDEKHKPSMSRLMLALWTYAGWLMIHHEMLLKPTDVSLSNATWTAWWAAEGFLGVAVFGPRIASYFGAGAAGAVTGIGASIRDGLAKIGEQVAAHTSPAPTITNTVNAPPAPSGETPVPDSLEGKG